MATIDAYTNFAYSKVFVAPVLPASGTTLTLAAGTGARLPAVPFNASVWPSSQYPDPTNAEIVRVTAVEGDVVSILRAQEATTARAIEVGDAFAATITKKTLDDLRDASNLNTGTLPDGRLPPSVPLLTATNHWTGKQYYDGQPQIVTDPAAPVGAKAFRQQQTGGYLVFDSLNEVTEAPVGPSPLRLKHGGGVYVDSLFVGDKPAVALETIYPVGSIYMNAINEANPATYFGFGTWVPFGPGRALVCYDAAQAEFNAAEKVGGEKAHTMLAPEMPFHTHVQDAHTHSVFDPGHTHGVTDPSHFHYNSSSAGSGNYIQDSMVSDNAGGGPAFTYRTHLAATGISLAGAVTGVSVFATTPTNQYAGGGVAHNNLQPFITCFMWKRTA